MFFRKKCDKGALIQESTALYSFISFLYGLRQTDFFLEGNSNILRKLSYLCTQNAEKDTIMTKEEAMTRFMAAKEKKRQCVARLEEKKKQSYEQRTGKP